MGSQGYRAEIELLDQNSALIHLHDPPMILILSEFEIVFHLQEGHVIGLQGRLRAFEHFIVIGEKRHHRFGLIKSGV
jgi:hypothetical protein